MKTTTVILVIVLAIMFVAGCVTDYVWPCVRDPLSIKYTGKEPNSVKWYNYTLAGAKQDMLGVEIKHAEKQLTLEMQKGIDEATYKTLKAGLTINIQASQEAFNKWIGDLESPGWLPAAVLGLLGISGTALYSKGTMYTEAELQAKITEAMAMAKSTTA